MKNIGNKIIYNNTQEILDPSHTALVVWDVQNTSVKRIFNKEEFSSRQQRDNSDVENNRNDNLDNYTRIVKYPQYY
jgi:tyrosyl-tRNA synthetase